MEAFGFFRVHRRWLSGAAAMLLAASGLAVAAPAEAGADDVRPQVRDIRTQLAEFDVDDEKDAKRIDKAVEKLAKADADELWMNDRELTKDGDKVFKEVRNAVKELQKVDGELPEQVGVERLAGLMQHLAQYPFGRAVALGGDAKEIGKAQKEFDKAASDRAKGDPDKAINHYKNAWKHAVKALNDVVDAPAIAISKNAPGPDTTPPVAAGEDAVFDIKVENIGTTDLSNVVVSDPAAPDCEQPVPDLAPGSIHTITCSASTDLGTAEIFNEASVTADGPGGIVVSASDSSTVPVLIPAVSLTKLTNDIDVDVDVDEVPEVPAGSVVEWTYVVENVGQGDLTDLVIEDFPEGFANCPATTLAEGATATCTLEGAAVVGEYANDAIASATNGGGLVVEASDSSGYVGVAGEVAGSGLVRFSSGGAVFGADVTGSFEGGSPEVTTTGADGGYSVAVEGGAPGQFRVDVETVVDGVTLSSTRFGYVPAGDDSVVLDPIELPNPADSMLFDFFGGAGDFSDFDEVQIFGLPPEVETVYGEAFDQQTEPNAFPGLLGDDSGNAFNSTVFAWLIALDGAGNEVTSFSSPVTVRLRIPSNQHGDVFDLTPGNGVIDIPMYSFDEATGDWVVEATGIVVNAAGAPYGEADAAGIRAGSFFDVFAEFETTHFSWWNVDYKKTDFPGSGDPNFFDFGDAGGTYPTTLADNGSRHSDPNRLWLGQWADLEADAKVVDLDDFDDGLLSIDPISVRVNNWDITGDIYLNVLIDRNDDGDWSDAGEWAVQNEVTGTPIFKGASYDTGTSWDPASEGVMRVTVTTVPITGYDGTGAFALGETEDYADVPPGDLFVEVGGDGAVTSDVGSIDCPAVDCEDEYPGGAAVTLTATPGPNRVFLGWGDECFDRGTNPTCIVVVEPSQTTYVSAVFSVPLERVFSLAPGSPTLLANGWSPADVLAVNSDLGIVERLLTAADLGLDPADDVDALYFPNSVAPPPLGPSQFGGVVDVGYEYSVDENSAGQPGSDIQAEASCPPGELGGDVWAVPQFFGELGGQLVQLFDEDGTSCAGNAPAAVAGLLPGDEIDGWSRFNVDDGVDPFFSLAPGSPTLGSLTASAGDILISSGGSASVAFSATEIGLDAGDDVDALSGNFGTGAFADTFSLSLAPGSPSLAVNSWSPATIITAENYFGWNIYGNYGPFDLGLLETDDVDALAGGDFFGVLA